MIKKIIFLIDWFFGGINFKSANTKYQVGDIIYPAYNNTNGWFCSSEWHVVTEVTPNKEIISYFKCDTLEAAQHISRDWKEKFGDIND